MKLALLVLAVSLPACLGYAYFQQRLPNGERIPHPCKPNYVWHGVGHKNDKGGGARNVFGEDFEKNGFVWDKCLCERDSDGDGRTNGEELGDPNCVWTPGSKPEVVASSKLSHPGVCDPHDGAACAAVNSWDFCSKQQTFSCPQLEREGVSSVTLRLPRTPVPAAVTTYRCMMWELDVGDLEGEVHLVGFTPVIDNVNVMHHIIIETVDDITPDSDAFKKYSSGPQPCDMNEQRLSLGGWTVGSDGDCLPEQYGFQVGGKSNKTIVLMQFHWNNPEQRADYFDSSGITFHYEQRRRPNTGAVASFIDMVLEIPPGQSDWEEYHICKAPCMETLGEKMYISSINPHMHYLGRRFRVEHWREGRKLADLVSQDDFRYDSPVTFRFEPAVEVLPSDEIKTRCFFNTKTKSGWTNFGQSTDDEMCIAFLSYYPVGKTSFACSGSGVESAVCGSRENMVMGNCSNIMAYMSQMFRTHTQQLSAVCDPTGNECKPGCKEATGVVHQHPCVQHPFFSIILGSSQRNLGAIRNMLNSCKAIPDDTPPQAETPRQQHPLDQGSLCAKPDNSAGAIVMSFSFLVATLAAVGLMQCN